MIPNDVFFVGFLWSYSYVYPCVTLINQSMKFGKFRKMIPWYRVFTPCGNDETNFRFNKRILVETIRKRQ